MIKYLLTDDALFILPIKTQVSTESTYFKEVLEICKDPNGNIEDLNFLSPHLDYTSDSVSIEDYGGKAEIYYNGKYYIMPDRLYTICINLIRNRTSFTLDMLASFLTKLFKNPHYNFEDLYYILDKYGFNFTPKGSVLLYKKFKEGEQNKKNQKEEFNPVTIQKFIHPDPEGGPSKIQKAPVYTVIEADPSEIEDGKVQNFIIRDTTSEDYLIGTYQNWILVNPIINAIFDTDGVDDLDLEDIKNNISNLLSKPIEDIISKGRLESIFANDDSFNEVRNNKDDTGLMDLVLRFCQE